MSGNGVLPGMRSSSSASGSLRVVHSPSENCYSEPFGRYSRITRWRWAVAHDRELWERICRGDTRAFDGFYRENVSRLNGFLRQLLGNMQTAEDVAQETFLQLWRRPN